MRILFGTNEGNRVKNSDLARAIEQNGVECRIVSIEIVTGFPSRKISEWIPNKKKFNDLINEFKPDAVLVDRFSYFALAVLDVGIPLLIRLRGNFWQEVDTSMKKDGLSIFRKFSLWYKIRLTKRYFRESKMIFPVSHYIGDIAEKLYPSKVTVIHNPVDASRWYYVEGMKLKHPCVGLVQTAITYDKVTEMLTLEKVLEALPDVTFYWGGGGGPHQDMVLDALEKYENFVFLGRLEYPDGVRKFLTGIDIYALITGLDAFPTSLLEAQLMQRPVIATSVGGVPEAMQDGKTGFLVEKGNPDQIIEKIKILLDDPQRAREMGKAGRRFVEENFNWNRIAKDFVNTLKLQKPNYPQNYDNN